MCILVGMCILLMSHMVQSLNLFISKLDTHSMESIWKIVSMHG